METGLMWKGQQRNAWVHRALGVLVAATLGGCSCNPGVPDPPPDDPEDTAPPTPPTEDTAPPPPCDVPEVEPNDSLTDATLLPMEQVACGSFSEPGDVDVFTAEVAEENWLEVVTVARNLGSSADVSLLLTPAEGGAVQRQDDEGTTDASLNFPSVVGPLTVSVTEQNNQGGGDYHYELVVSISKAPVDWTATEVEPNDGQADAGLWAHGDRIFGDMDSNLDSDWYGIDVPEGRHLVTATVEAYAFGSAGDFNLTWFDAGLNLLAGPLFRHPIDPALHDPILEYESTGGETLYLKLSENDFRWGGHAWYVLDLRMEAL